MAELQGHLVEEVEEAPQHCLMNRISNLTGGLSAMRVWHDTPRVSHFVYGGIDRGWAWGTS